MEAGLFAFWVGLQLLGNKFVRSRIYSHEAMKISPTAPVQPNSGGSTPTRSAPAQENRWDDNFDLTELDHSREMYFLPGVDRLAATLAARSDSPLKVRLEAQGQFLEYVLDNKDPHAPIHGSLNGKPFTFTNSPGEQPDQREVESQTSGGKVRGTLYQLSDGSSFSGLVEHSQDSMPITQRLNYTSPDGKLPVGEIIGNFACARMFLDIEKEGDGLLIAGDMGSYKVEAHLKPSGNGYVSEGHLGELEFRQFFTPVQG